ncbi:MAG: hypothetical protein WEA31_07995 [Pirellulales bacterium]
MSSHHEADKIREEMARLRGGLHREVEGIVESARTMTDYRYYLRRYPWGCAAAAVAVGYLIVPNKTRIISPDVATLKELAKNNQLLVKAKPEVSKQQPGPLNLLLHLAASSLVRAGVSYAGQQASRFFAESQGQQEQPEPRRQPPRGQRTQW